jgi:hypothetical protein
MSTQEQALLGRRGLPLAAAGRADTPARPRRSMPWERRPRALDVQETPAALSAGEGAQEFDDFDGDSNAPSVAHERHRDAQGLSPQSAEHRLASQAAAVWPASPPTPRPDVATAQSALLPVPRGETEGFAVPPLFKPKAVATAAAPAPQQILRTETVTRTVEKYLPNEAAPLTAPAPRPPSTPGEVRIDRHPFGLTAATAAVAAPPSPAPIAAARENPSQTPAAIVHRIDRLMLSPAAAPPPSSELQDSAAPHDAPGAAAVSQAVAPRRAFGLASAEPLPAAAPKAVSLEALRNAPEAAALSIGSLQVVIKPAAPPLIAGAAPAAAQQGNGQPPTAAAPARPARSAYRNPWFAARRGE